MCNLFSLISILGIKSIMPNVNNKFILDFYAAYEIPHTLYVTLDLLILLTYRSNINCDLLVAREY